MGAVDLLKMDVEGAELEVLGSFKGLDRVRTVIGELHTDLVDASEEQFFSLLQGFDIEAKRPRPGICVFRAVRSQARSGPRGARFARRGSRTAAPRG
jgi:hypothetical protein